MRVLISRFFACKLSGAQHDGVVGLCGSAEVVLTVSSGVSRLGWLSVLCFPSRIAFFFQIDWTCTLGGT